MLVVQVITPELYGKMVLEELTGIPTQVEIASEYIYRNTPVPDNTLFIFISQSGETADTLAMLNKVGALGQEKTSNL